jgi:hypothetical protein
MADELKGDEVVGSGAAGSDLVGLVNQRVKVFTESLNQSPQVVVRGEKVVFPSGQKAIVDRSRLLAAATPPAVMYPPATHPATQQRPPYVFCYENEDDVIEVGDGLYAFAQNEAEMFSRDSSGVMPTQTMIIVGNWQASDPAVGHQKGTPYNDNAGAPWWWHDPCDSSEGWTCYGPYVTLEPARYGFNWQFNVDLEFCSSWLPDWIVVSGDVVTHLGEWVIVPEKFYSSYWICSHYGGHIVQGGVSGTFTLYETTPLVEFRMRGHFCPGATLIARNCLLWKIIDIPV